MVANLSNYEWDNQSIIELDKIKFPFGKCINFEKISINGYHPYDIDKYLVHTYLEGPESGVYYRGEGTITNNNFTTIKLPYYVNKLATEFTVNITPIYDDNYLEDINLKCSRVLDNKFNVYGKNCSFFWCVYGKRLSLEIEPNKKNTNVKGNGPYTWI